jgi:hypothetical protein
MVALMLSAIVVTIIFQFLLGQGRFARMQTAREEVQQNARFALDVITGDLRGSGSPGTLVAATANSITFRRPRVWGIVCAFNAGNLTVLFPENGIGAFSTGADSLAVLSGSVPNLTWEYSNGTDNTSSQATAAAVACTTDNTAPGISPDPPVVIPPEPADSRARAYGNVTFSAPPSGGLLGRPVYLYDLVRYRLGTSTVTAIPGTWIQRQDGAATQPLAGPVPAGTGLTFTYFDAAGVRINNPTTQLQLNAIDRIGVRVVTQSRAEGTIQQTDTDSTLVYLRN